MPDLTIRGVSDELHGWLKQQAATHHRSLNRETVALLEKIRADTRQHGPRLSAEEIMSKAKRFANLPILDHRSADEIVGYDESGLPG